MEKRGKTRGPATQDDIAPAIGACSRGMVAALMAGVAKHGYSDMTPAFASLIPLLDAEGARPTALAQRAGVTKQAISQMASELEARGYVEQVADPTDTRAKIMRLTARGVALRAACVQVRRQLQELAAQALGETRVQRLRRDLMQLAEALESSGRSPP